MIKTIKGKPRSLLPSASITSFFLNSTNEKTVAILNQGIHINQTSRFARKKKKNH